MERAVAVKRLSKMLGKKFGYQIDPKAPNKEQRAAARAEHGDAVKIRDEIGKRWTARKDAVLAADAEYQRIAAEYKTARERVEKLSGMLYHTKICVGTSEGMFFHVLASGDSWEEIFEILEKLDVKKKSA